MTDNITYIGPNTNKNSEQVVDERRSEAVIGLLTNLLKDAEEGKLLGIAVATNENTLSSTMYLVGAVGGYKMSGAVAQLQYEINLINAEAIEPL